MGSDSTIAEQLQRIDALHRQVAEQAARIVELETEVRELRPAVLMRKTSFGSRNIKGSATLSDGLTLIRSLPPLTTAAFLRMRKTSLTRVARFS